MSPLTRFDGLADWAHSVGAGRGRADLGLGWSHRDGFEVRSRLGYGLTPSTSLFAEGWMAYQQRWDGGALAGIQYRW